MTRYARAGWRIIGPLQSLFLLTALALLVGIAGCATMAAPTPRGTLDAGYQALVTYHRLVGDTVDRDAISSAAAFRLIAEGEKVRTGVLDRARDALTLCGGKLPCETFDVALRDLKPRLADLERRLRAEEAAKKAGAKP